MYVIRNEMRHVPRLSIRGEREVQTFEFILCRNCLITQLVKNNHPSQCNRWGNIKQPNKKSSCSAQKKPIINTVEIIHAKAKLIPGITPLLREGGGGNEKKNPNTNHKKMRLSLCFCSTWYSQRQAEAVSWPEMATQPLRTAALQHHPSFPQLHTRDGLSNRTDGRQGQAGTQHPPPQQDPGGHHGGKD